jgi:hypothetical protein
MRTKSRGRDGLSSKSSSGDIIAHARDSQAPIEGPQEARREETGGVQGLQAEAYSKYVRGRDEKTGGPLSSKKKGRQRAGKKESRVDSSV